MRLFNGTPHPINVMKGSQFNPEIRKYNGGELFMTIPSDGMLSAKLERVEADSILGIQVYNQSYSGVDSLPEGYDGYIVSALYANAYRKVNGYDGVKLLTIADVVVNDELKPVGCTGFILN